MNTETIEIKLENSGQTAVLRKYLTTGQSRELQRLLLSRGNYNSEKGNFENVPTEVYLDMQDKALSFLLLELKDSEGNSQPYSKELVDGLPIKDGNVLYEAVNDLINESNLSEEQKKK